MKQKYYIKIEEILIFCLLRKIASKD